MLCDLTKDKACLPWFVIEDKGGMQCRNCPIGQENGPMKWEPYFWTNEQDKFSQQNVWSCSVTGNFYLFIYFIC